MALLTTLYRGDTKQFAFTFKDRNEVVTDISGHIIFVAIKKTLADADGAVGTVFVAHAAGSGPNDDPVNGRAVVTIPSNQTAALDPAYAAPEGLGVHIYEFQRVIPAVGPDAAIVHTIEQGQVRVLRDAVQGITP